MADPSTVYLNAMREALKPQAILAFDDWQKTDEGMITTRMVKDGTGTSVDLFTAFEAGWKAALAGGKDG